MLISLMILLMSMMVNYPGHRKGDKKRLQLMDRQNPNPTALNTEDDIVCTHT